MVTSFGFLSFITFIKSILLRGIRKLNDMNNYLFSSVQYMKASLPSVPIVWGSVSTKLKLTHGLY